MNITWDAKGYQRNFQFVPQYGEDVLNLLELVPGASVLDLGCGNGALTRKLADRGYRVLGLDESREMLQIAAKAYPDLSFMRADATSFVVPEPVDAVFSNAVFHWIEDQDALLAHVASALRPGGATGVRIRGQGMRGERACLVGTILCAARPCLSPHLLFPDHRRVCSPP